MMRIVACILLAFVAVQTVAFGLSDEATIRQIVEKTTGTTTFSLTITPIKEGLTNRNYKVLCNETPLFVRLGHKDPKSLRIDRVKELAFYALAEKDGIAPRLLYSDSSTGTLIAPFIRGTSYGKKGGTWLYERSESIKKIVALFRRYHSHQSPGGERVDYPFQIVEEYIQQARISSIPLPKDIDRVVDIVQRLKSRIPQHTKVLCHQDLVPDNFIFDGKTLYLVDWEYAEWSDPVYDLAAFCIEHECDEEEKQMVLNAYYGIPTEEQRIHLEMMCMLYSLRDSLWYFLEQARSSQQTADFLSLAQHHYQNFFASERWLQAHHITLNTSSITDLSSEQKTH